MEILEWTTEIIKSMDNLYNNNSNNKQHNKMYSIHSTHIHVGLRPLAVQGA